MVVMNALINTKLFGATNADVSNKSASSIIVLLPSPPLAIDPSCFPFSPTLIFSMPFLGIIPPRLTLLLRYPTLFTPAGYAFSIWGIIWAFYFCFMVYQALPFQRKRPNGGFLAEIHVILIVNQVANGCWGSPIHPLILPRPLLPPSLPSSPLLHLD